jgi:hypothetical protein
MDLLNPDGPKNLASSGRTKNPEWQRSIKEQERVQEALNQDPQKAEQILQKIRMEQDLLNSDTQFAVIALLLSVYREQKDTPYPQPNENTSNSSNKNMWQDPVTKKEFYTGFVLVILIGILAKVWHLF